MLALDTLPYLYRASLLGCVSASVRESCFWICSRLRSQSKGALTLLATSGMPMHRNLSRLSRQHTHSIFQAASALSSAWLVNPDKLCRELQVVQGAALHQSARSSGADEGVCC